MKWILVILNYMMFNGYKLVKNTKTDLYQPKTFKILLIKMKNKKRKLKKKSFLDLKEQVN